MQAVHTLSSEGAGVQRPLHTHGSSGSWHSRSRVVVLSVLLACLAHPGQTVQL